MRRAVLLLPVLLVAPTGCGTGAGVGSNGPHTVIYKIEGTSKASTISFTTPAGTTQEENVQLPWTKQFEAKGSNSLSVNAQSKDGGGVSCSISVDGKEVAARKSDLELPVASCDSFIAS